MRKSINANVNVIRPEIRRNREAVVACGVDALRASGPGYRMFHAMRPDHLGLDRPRGGLRLLDSRSSLIASSAWRSLPILAGACKAKTFAGTCFTSTTRALQQPQAALRQVKGRGERKAVLAALPIARLSASA
jgi:hypothetical protein